MVLNCVGPFRFYGEPVARACAEAGTDYLDICGEPGAATCTASEIKLVIGEDENCLVMQTPIRLLLVNAVFLHQR
jgi:saccharopine dehydrogenase-like NADP-dependent oxidoreductase